MADHECYRCPECGSCPACAADALDRVIEESESLREERDEARQEAKRLISLTQNWYEGRARIGAHMTFVDQRFYDSVRLQRTGWPGDDANGDGGPPEE